MIGWSIVREARELFFRRLVLWRRIVFGQRSARLSVTLDRDEPPNVFRITTVNGLPKTIENVEDILRNRYSHLLKAGQRVLVKINLNTALPYPASTSPEMLRALLGLFHKMGITDLLVGDCSSNRALPTRRQARSAGILNAVADLAQMICFDEQRWFSVPVKGHYLKTITIPQAVFEVDRIVALANMKSHSLADFSFGLKLGVGFMHPLERHALHRGNLQEKATEINLAVQSDLTIIDGRTAFLTGGPDEGERVQSNALLIGLNPLAVDLEAYQCLFALRKAHDKIGSFQSDPLAMVQFGHALKIGLGGASWRGYQCIYT